MKTAETDEAPPSSAESSTALAVSEGSADARALDLGERLARLRPTLLFLLAWAFIDAMLNIRYPAEEPAFWYIVPTADVVVLFAFLALLGWGKAKVPGWFRAVLVFLVLLVRLVRLGDGIQEHYFAQPFNLYTDLPLALELVRFGLSTLGLFKLTAVLIGGLALVGATSYALYRAFEHAERYLSDLRQAAGVGALSALVFVAGAGVEHDPDVGALYTYGFGTSAYKRLRYEAKFAANLHGTSSVYAQRIERAAAELESAPHDLALLGGRNVHLILVESYGETVFARESFARAMEPVIQRYDIELAQQGMSVVTGLFDSPTYGGRSWLAHATLGTGVKVENQLEYAIICARASKTLARFFKQAGYRTVLAQPGTTRAWPKGEFYGFDHKYYLWNFDYRGPPFAWATMPDEYVLDFMGRRELSPAKAPLFVQYTLVSSHAPWSDIPLPVPDPKLIGDGALFNDLPRVQFPIEWPHFQNASEAYITSILYDFEVIRRFLSTYVKDDALVIVLGDHQPVSEVTENAESHGVPVHVFSRSQELLAPFRARGYVAGLRPSVGAPRAGLETFMASLLSDLSKKPR
jgi:hypothetical protein